MYRSLLVLSLSAAFVGGAPLLTSVVDAATGTRLTERAEAADFRGRIKPIRIRPRRSATGFRVVGITESAAADSITTTKVVISNPDTGKELTSMDLGDATHARRAYATKSDVVTVVDGDSISVEIEAGVVASDGTVSTKTTTTTVAVPLEKTDAGGYIGEAAGDNGWKTRVRINAAGHLRTVLLHENKAWQGDGVTSVCHVKKIGRVCMVSGLVRHRWRATSTTDVGTLDTLDVTTTIYDAKGGEIDSLTETVHLDDALGTPAVDKIRVAETKKGVAKLVTWTTSPEGGSLEVELLDEDTDKVQLDTIDDSPVFTQRSFLSGDVGFDDGDESPAGYSYLVLIDRLDAEGSPTGTQYEVSIDAPKSYDDAVGASYADFGDGSGRLGLLRDDDGYYFHVALSGEASLGVDSVGIIFEEPFEGPEPSETEVSVPFTSRYDKWIQKGTSALPSSFSVSATVLDSKGAALSSVDGASGTDTGVVYKNGDDDKKKKDTVKEDPDWCICGWLEITRG